MAGVVKFRLLWSAMSAKKQKVSGADIENTQKQCLTVLKAVKRKKEAIFFLDPVDWKALNLPLYPKLIKKPMDLGTVEQKLQDTPCAYKTVAAFADEVNLVWSNAQLFNLEGSEIYEFASSCKSAFEAKMAQEADKINLEIEMRTRELQRNKEEKRQEFEEEEARAREEEGAVSTEMITAHSKELDDMEDLIRTTQQRMEKARAEAEAKERVYFDQAEKLQKQVIVDRRILAVSNIRRIRKEALAKIRTSESEWQGRAAR